MHTKKLLTAVISFAIALLPAAAHADTFAYALSNHFSSFSVDGTITTDTNAGVLSSDDIVDFNLLISAAGQSETFTLANVDAYGVYGDALTATDTGLFFDFDAFGAGLFFSKNSTGSYLCVQTYGCDTSDMDAHISTNVSGSTLTEEQAGNVQLAAFVPSAVTPEPSSLLLLSTGMLAVLAYARRQPTAL